MSTHPGVDPAAALHRRPCRAESMHELVQICSFLLADLGTHFPGFLRPSRASPGGCRCPTAEHQLRDPLYNAGPTSKKRSRAFDSDGTVRETSSSTMDRRMTPANR